MSAVPPAVRKISEAAFQKAVVQLAETLGWRVAHHHDSRRQVAPGKFVGDRDAAGLPDLILVKGSRLLLVELKAEHGRLRPAQQRWIEALGAVEADAAGRVLVREFRPSQWDEIVALLTGRPA